MPIIEPSRDNSRGIPPISNFMKIILMVKQALKRIRPNLSLLRFDPSDDCTKTPSTQELPLKTI
jgi:hypothetical protein